MIRDAFRVTETAAARTPARHRVPRASSCTTMRVDPRVLQTAKDLAGGDLSRLVIERTGSVLVTNNRPTR